MNCEGCYNFKYIKSSKIIYFNVYCLFYFSLRLINSLCIIILIVHILQSGVNVPLQSQYESNGAHDVVGKEVFFWTTIKEHFDRQEYWDRTPYTTFDQFSDHADTFHTGLWRNRPICKLFHNVWIRYKGSILNNETDYCTNFSVDKGWEH